MITSEDGSSIPQAIAPRSNVANPRSNGSQGQAAAVHQKLPTLATSGDSSISMPTRPNGTAGILVSTDHVTAPVDTRPVPRGSAIYTPSGDTMNCSDFVSWMTAHRTANLPSKFLKVTLGIYGYDLGAIHALDADANPSPEPKRSKR